MKINKTGSGFVSIYLWRDLYLVLAWRQHWRFAWVRPPQKPWVKRLFIGRLEAELSDFSPTAPTSYKSKTPR